MLSRLVRALSLSFLLLPVAAAAGQADSPPCPVRIVVLDLTGQPLPGALLRVLPSDRQLVSAEGGVACLTGLADGEHELVVRFPGFEELRRAVAVTGGTARLSLTLRPALSAEVVVTGTRAEREVGAVPYSISVVDRDELARSGADSPAEALRDLPGVQITDTSLGGGKRVRIRGEVGSNVLVLVDGREISEQRSFHGGAPLLLDLGDVERVEVVRGPSSVAYGSKAIGGTVNFIPAPPAAEPFAGRASVTLNSATAGYDGGAAVSGTLPWLDYRVSASRSRHLDRRVPSSVSDNDAYGGGSGRLEHSAFDTEYLTAEVGRRWGGSRLALRAESYGSSVEAHTSNDVLAGGLAAFQLDLPRQDRRAVALTYRGANLSRRIASAAVTAYRQRRDRDFTQALAIAQPNIAGPGSALRVDMAIGTVYRQDTTGLLTSVEWLPAQGHRLVGGLDVTSDAMEATVSDVTTTTITLPRLPRPIVTMRASEPVTATRQTAAGVFVQEEWAASPRVKLVAGTRWNHFVSSLDRTTNPRLPSGESSRGRLASSAGLVVQAHPGAALRASYAQGYRHPSLLELYEGTAHGGGGLLYPNPALGPETSHNVEAGARLESGPLAVDVSVFYTRARDYVTTRSCGGDAPCPAGAVAGTDRVYDNVDGARTHGLEAAATWRVTPRPVEIFADATYLARTFESSGASTSRTGLPAWWGRAGIRAGRAAPGSGAGMAELFVRAATTAEEDLGAGKTARYAGWATVEARLARDLGPRVPATLSIEAGNLLNRAYRPAQETLYHPGRHVVARLLLHF